MIGTPDAPLAVPYDCKITKPVISDGSIQPSPSPLQNVSNTPAPHFQEGTMWKLDGKGGFIQVHDGEQLSSNVYRAHKDGQLRPLSHPVDKAIGDVPPNSEGLAARVLARIRSLFSKAG